jgi:hypothetical protein
MWPNALDLVLVAALIVASFHGTCWIVRTLADARRMRGVRLLQRMYVALQSPIPNETREQRFARYDAERIIIRLRLELIRELERRE